MEAPTLIEIANEIGARDRAIGILALEAIASAEDGRGTAALACLFVLFEHAIRHLAESPDSENLNTAINRLRAEGLVDEQEAETLHGIRDMRNKFLHPNRHGYAFTLNGMLYPLNETDGLVEVFEALAPSSFDICLGLLSRS